MGDTPLDCGAFLKIHKKATDAEGSLAPRPTGTPMPPLGKFLLRAVLALDPTVSSRARFGWVVV